MPMPVTTDRKGKQGRWISLHGRRIFIQDGGGIHRPSGPSNLKVVSLRGGRGTVRVPEHIYEERTGGSSGTWRGHSAVGLARHLGKHGWSVAEVTDVFSRIGITSSPITIRVNVGGGRLGNRQPAAVTPEQHAELENLRKGATPPPVVKPTPPKPEPPTLPVPPVTPPTPPPPPPTRRIGPVFAPLPAGMGPDYVRPATGDEMMKVIAQWQSLPDEVRRRGLNEEIHVGILTDKAGWKRESSAALTGTPTGTPQVHLRLSDLNQGLATVKTQLFKAGVVRKVLDESSGHALLQRIHQTVRLPVSSAKALLDTNLEKGSGGNEAAVADFLGKVLEAHTRASALKTDPLDYLAGRVDAAPMRGQIHSAVSGSIPWTKEEAKEAINLYKAVVLDRPSALGGYEIKNVRGTGKYGVVWDTVLKQFHVYDTTKGEPSTKSIVSTHPIQPLAELAAQELHTKDLTSPGNPRVKQATEQARKVAEDLHAKVLAVKRPTEEEAKRIESLTRETIDAAEERSKWSKETRDIESFHTKYPTIKQRDEVWARIATIKYRQDLLQRELRRLDVGRTGRGLAVLKVDKPARLVVTGVVTNNIAKGVDLLNDLLGEGTHLDGASLPNKPDPDTGERAYAQKGYSNTAVDSHSFISVHADTTAEVVAHEIVHHLEYHDPLMLKESVEFRNSRAKSLVPKKLSTLLPDRGYKSHEEALDCGDKFFSPYCAKVYRSSTGEDRATEVMTMGVQRILEDPVGFAEKDPEYFKFTLTQLRRRIPHA